MGDLKTDLPTFKTYSPERRTLAEFRESCESYRRRPDILWMSQESWDQHLADCEVLMPEDPVIIESTPRTAEEQEEFEHLFLEES